jgi:hypothetical protein
MSDPSPHEIASSLTPGQREIVILGPKNWDEADALPEGLFDYDETYDPDTAEESCFWSPTDLGKLVYDIVVAEDDHSG